SQPISAIKNYSTAINKVLDRNSGELIVSSLEGISFEAERASKFIHSLRSFIGSRRPDKKIEKLNEVVSDVMVLLKGELDAKRINVRLSLAEPSLEVPVDKIQLIQVVLNLFRNAIESLNMDSNDYREI